jgi:hypothetical protein
MLLFQKLLNELFQNKNMSNELFQTNEVHQPEDTNKTYQRLFFNYVSENVGNNKYVQASTEVVYLILPRKRRGG